MQVMKGQQAWVFRKRASTEGRRKRGKTIIANRNRIGASF
jgi:hypothetical protein